MKNIQQRRDPLLKAAANIQRAIDRELPDLVPDYRRALLVAILSATAVRLREFDRGAEANRGIKAPDSGIPLLDTHDVLTHSAVECDTAPLRDLDV